MTQSASLSLIDAATVATQRARRSQPLPLSELAVANRLRDALYLLSDRAASCEQY